MSRFAVSIRIRVKGKCIELWVAELKFQFSHPEFDTFTLHANADTDGEPGHRYRASPHLNNNVPYDDPQLTIKPNPSGQSAHIS